MKWQKIGLIFNPELIKELNYSAALVPIVEVLDEENDLVRVNILHVTV